MKRLKISSDSELLIDLEWDDGKLTQHFVKEDLQKSVDRWVEWGVMEWVQDGPEYHDCYPRSTYVAHPQFLFRLKRYLEKQFKSFTYELTE